MSRAASATVSWRESLALYLHPRVLQILFLGFAAGLPYLLVFSTMSAWMREWGVSRTTIGFASWVGITYSIKVFWAPVVDRLRLPVLHGALGQRRSWMLCAQIVIAIALVGMAQIGPGEQLREFVMLALVVAFASATQDIAIDAFRIEAADDNLQAYMAANYILGYRFAMLVAGAGALYLADFFDWRAAYSAMAALMTLGMLTTLLVREPEHKPDPIAEQLRSADEAHAPLADRVLLWFQGALWEPFADFFRRNGHWALVILLFIALYRVSDISMGVMANPFYLDLGFTKSQIASVAKFFGFFMTIGGAMLGGVLVTRYGVMRPLLLAAVLVAVTNLLFAALALVGPDVMWLAVTISADNLSGGMSYSIFIAYMSGLTNRVYTATQYAVFSSLMTLVGKYVGGWSGWVVDHNGYVGFFIYAAFLGVPGIALTLVLMRHERKLAAADEP